MILCPTCLAPDVEITLTNAPEDRQRLHEALEQFARRHDISPKGFQAADLALEEHLTNVFTHGFAQSGSHTILVRLEIESSWFKIEVEDEGKPFDPANQPKVDTSKPLEEKEIGGLGIHLMRQFMDELDYKTIGGRNVLTMRKKLD